MEFLDVAPPLPPDVHRKTSIPPLHLIQFRGIRDASKLKSTIIKSEDTRLHKLLFLDSTLICGAPQLRLAIIKSYDSESRKTNSIGAEVVYNLWWKKNLKDAFKYFGINDKTTRATVIGFGFESAAEVCHRWGNVAFTYDAPLLKFEVAATHFVDADGREANIDKIGESCDVEKLRKLFQVADGDDTISTVLERMALRDVL